MVAGEMPSIWRRMLEHPLWAPFNDVAAWERGLARINPFWSLDQPRARVERVVDEAPGVRSIWLRPNGRFLGHRPGQHLLLELELDGVRQARSYSLSAPPRADGLIRLTIKAQAGGRVSPAAHRLRKGDIVRISQAMGDFAPAVAQSKLLLIGAGSGITPLLAWIGHLHATEPTRDVVLIDCLRSDADAICAEELRSLAQNWPQLQVLRHRSRDHGHLDGTAIERLVPDWRQREALLCGPDSMMAAISAFYADAGLLGMLHCERFGLPPAAPDPMAAAHPVHVQKPEQTFTTMAGQSLLLAAEQAGLQPRYGCRRGICRSCQCRKTSGTVLNLLTGQRSSPGEELIQLCISTPLSAVELAL